MGTLNLINHNQVGEVALLHKENNDQGPVVQKQDTAIHRINLYPLDKC